MKLPFSIDIPDPKFSPGSVVVTTTGHTLHILRVTGEIDEEAALSAFQGFGGDASHLHYKHRYLLVVQASNTLRPGQMLEDVMPGGTVLGNANPVPRPPRSVVTPDSLDEVEARVSAWRKHGALGR